MKALAVIAWLLSASMAFAGPISGYPAASTPYNATDQILGTQPANTGATVNYTPAGLAAFATANGTTTGSYPGQAPQPLPANLQPDCLNITSYLTQAQQAAVLAGTSTVDFTPILTEAIASVSANPGGGPPAQVNGTNIVCLPPGKLNFQSTLHVVHTVIIRGTGGAGIGSFGYGTQLVWAANTPGIVIDTAATSGTTDGSGSILEDLAVMSKGGGTNAAIYGIQMRAKSTIRNVAVGGFGGDQIHIEACAGCGGSIEGNDNGWLVDQVSVTGNAPLPGVGDGTMGINGLFIQGADANAGMSRSVNAGNLRGWGLYDNSFLGNVHIAPEAASTGQNSRVNFSGTSYWANPTTTSSLLASTTPGTNAAVWIAIASGSYPTWTNGGTYFPGGGYASPGVSERTLWLGAYDEGGDPPSFGNQFSQTIAGLNVGGWVGPIANVINSQGVLYATNTPIAVQGLTTGGVTQTIQLGLYDVNQKTSGVALQWTDSSKWSSPLKWYECGATGGDMCFGTASLAFSQFTGPSTSLTFGRSAIFSGAHYIANLQLGGFGGSGIGNGLYGGCTSSPTSTGHAVGEICFNSTPAIGQPLGWIETVRGSPDTWVSLPTITNQAGVNCSGSPTSSFATVNGVVTHC